MLSENCATFFPASTSMIFSVTTREPLTQFLLSINKLLPAERLQKRNPRVRLLSERHGHHVCIGRLTERRDCLRKVMFLLTKEKSWNGCRKTGFGWYSLGPCS